MVSLMGCMKVSDLPLRMSIILPHSFVVSELGWQCPHKHLLPTLELGPSPASPLDCLLGQHSIASQKCHSAQDSQVLQGLEHVELSPVDIHEPQHCYKKCHDIQLNEAGKIGGRG